MQHHPQRPELSSEEIAIVLLGDFNPKIYQPTWFAAEGLLRASEADAARVEVIHSDFTVFSTDWLVLQVARERFQATIRAPAYQAHLRDLVLGTFHKLSHTPVYQMGINYVARFRFKSDEDWHAFGHFILPKSAWGQLLVTPGLRNATIEGRRPDNLPGYLQVGIEAVRGEEGGVLIRCNDHSEVNREKTPIGAAFFIELIERDFDASIERSREVLAGLLERFSQTTSFDGGQ